MAAADPPLRARSLFTGNLQDPYARVIASNRLSARGKQVSPACSWYIIPAVIGCFPLPLLRCVYDARSASWVTRNIDSVLEASKRDVGYMHITAMGGGGVMQFDKYWRAFRCKKGLIIDVRGNSGGWTEYFMIDKLERQQVANNVLQGMEPYRYPNPASRAHYVLVSNEDNGSDGEAFGEHFRARKLGTIVGVPSWGGLVGIVNGQRTIDNGTVQ